MRIFYIVAGISNLILALLGAILPIMPTFIFLVLAIWFFMKVDDRFVFWLHHHPYYIRLIRYMDRMGMERFTHHIKPKVVADSQKDLSQNS